MNEMSIQLSSLSCIIANKGFSGVKNGEGGGGGVSEVLAD